MAEYRLRVGGRRFEVRDTALDRAIGYFSPSTYNARMRNRAVQAYALSGGYTTRRKRRSLSQWAPSDGDADAMILPDLVEMREESGDLCRTDALASGALRTKLTSVIGSGLRVVPTVDAEFLGLSDEQADEIEFALLREWRMFAETSECDLERQSNFSQLTRMAYDGKNKRGDVFALLPFKARPGSPYSTKIQLIEADRVSNPDFKQDTMRISGGVQRGASGEFEGIWLTRQHPGSEKPGAFTRKWDYFEAFGERTGRRNVLHVYDKLRPGQSRGVPDLAPVVEPIKQIGRYMQAEIDAAVVSGMFTVFLKVEGGSTLAPMEPTGDSGATASDSDIKLMSGGIVGLNPGESIETASPGRPNEAFDPFMLSVLRMIGVGLELPFEILVKHFTASYSAARAAINEAFKYFLAERSLMRDMWAQPIYEAVIEEAVLRGRVGLPGFVRDPAARRAYLGTRWVGPGRGQINEVQEVEAAVRRADNNLSTKAEETAMLNGGDYEQNLRTRRREVQSERRLGIGPSGGSPDE